MVSLNINVKTNYFQQWIRIQILNVCQIHSDWATVRMCVLIVMKEHIPYATMIKLRGFKSFCATMELDSTKELHTLDFCICLKLFVAGFGLLMFLLVLQLRNLLRSRFPSFLKLWWCWFRKGNGTTQSGCHMHWKIDHRSLSVAHETEKSIWARDTCEKE